MHIEEVCRLLGLPQKVAEIYAARGIHELYPPQEAALRSGITEGKSLVLAAPTASGKTMVAELLMLHVALIRGGRSIYLVPLRALAGEKHREFRELFSQVGLELGISTGDFDRVDRELAANDVLILTNERADSIMRQRPGWFFKGLELVVVDEVHLLGDPYRGPTLEVLLSALRRERPDLQLLALSATIGNPDELAAWLGAEAVVSDFRPVPLRKGIFWEGALFFPGEPPRPLEVGGRAEPIVALAMDSVQEGGQALIFVATRRSAQATARKLARHIERLLTEEERKELHRLAEEIQGEIEGRTSLSVELAKCLPSGVAFHHAGLPGRHRHLVEEAFRRRLIKVLCTTTTLAAGVNLPARRVVIRDVRRYAPPYGSSYIPALEYHQMAGRAGRPGLDPFGEAVLIAKSEDEIEELISRYVLAPPEEIRSQLAQEGALLFHLLGVIAARYVRTLRDIPAFFSLTLFARQFDPAELAEALRRGLAYLAMEDFVSEEGERLYPTDFGALTARLYIHPVTAVTLREGLREAQPREERPALAFLHLIAATPDMELVRVSSRDLPELEAFVEDSAGIWFLETPAFGERGFKRFLAEVKTAQVLVNWIEEKTEEELYIDFGVGPGDLHRLVETADWLLYAAERIAELFEMRLPELPRLRRRVRYGVREELLPLVALRGIGRVRARVLYEAGFTDPAKIARATPERIAALPHFGKKLAENLVVEARDYVRSYFGAR
ncbi:DEAD/DEAH box helicase [Candidatus Bipolaricaulota sp. J31]